LLEELPHDVPKMPTLTQSQELWPSSCMPHHNDATYFKSLPAEVVTAAMTSTTP
jgi:hypothetical protein